MQGGRDSEGTEKDWALIEYPMAMILTGFIGVVASAYLAETYKPLAGSLVSALCAGLTTLSVAMIGMSLFSWVVETRGWKKYFSERLKEIVVDSDYLKSLDPETLKELQSRALKAQFKDQKIDREGGFLNYFHLHLYRYISEPYREDVSSEIILKNVDGRADVFKAVDKVRYVCRANSGGIQSHVNWKPDDGEFESVESLKITVQYPSSHRSAGETETIYEKCGADLEIDLKSGVKASLSKYEGIDYLIVIIESVYFVKSGVFQYWQMAHPSRNFEIIILYPETLEIQFKTLVLDDVVSQVTRQPGYLKFGYGTWALPQSGMVWLVNRA